MLRSVGEIHFQSRKRMMAPNNKIQPLLATNSNTGCKNLGNILESSKLLFSNSKEPKYPPYIVRAG
jgi:hypothetical protein